MNNIVFLSGLPRSGSTVLCAILSQNPGLRVNEASTLLPLLNQVRKFWSSAPRHGAVNKDSRLLPVLQAIFNSYHSESNKIVIDKHREWPLYLDLIEKINTKPVKVICTVRSPIECAASFERLYIDEPETYTQLEQLIEGTGPTTLDRANAMLHSTGSIGKAYTALYEAAVVQNRYKQMLFVDYNKLCNDPQTQINRIYNFLELDAFTYSFTNLVNAELQNDIYYQSYTKTHVIEKDVREPDHSLGRLNMFIKLLQETAPQEFWQKWI